MLIVIFGENCTGKSSLAQEIARRITAEIVTGKDYLRMAKSESVATALFKKKLAAAVDGENLIYIISEQEHLSLIPEGALRILAAAELDDIKERFKSRMRGTLPPPVEMMLEKKHGAFDAAPREHTYDSSHDSPAAFCDRLTLG